MRIPSIRVWFAGVSLLLLSFGVHAASPLVAPGDYQFRHDITLLRDAGLLSGPIGLWPVSLPQLNADLAKADIDAESLAPSVRAALRRVRHRLERAKAGQTTTEVSVRAGVDTPFIRSFDDAPRGDTEAGVGASWTGERFAGELHVAYVDGDPADDDKWRLDGSWLGVRMGNWMLAGGKIQRSWGPGWQGGIDISNNARPRPGLTFRRMRTDAFETPWLSWIGPWNLTVFVEQLESGRAVSDALLAGMRLSFSPIQSLQLGISRSAIFGGEGNSVGFDTIVNLVSGQTTSTNTLAGDDDAIDQLGGFDARWKLPWVNAALYGEMIGEDESGSRPNLMMGQGGLEMWGGLWGSESGSWRLILERVDTKADILDSSEREGDAELGVAYNNNAFPTGYRYRNRVLGHPAEGDALVSTARLLVNFWDSSLVNLSYVTGDLNRGRTDNNTLTMFKEEVEQVQLSAQHQFRFGRVEFGVGRFERDPVDTGVDDTDEEFFWVGFDRQF